MKEKLTTGRQEKNLMPSKSDQRRYLKQLRQNADAGDSVSMIGLLVLSRLEESIKQMKHIDNGIINLPGHGGWCGDPGDPKEAILKAIRENDPQSEQLPENQ